MIYASWRNMYIFRKDSKGFRLISHRVSNVWTSTLYMCQMLSRYTSGENLAVVSTSGHTNPRPERRIFRFSSELETLSLNLIFSNTTQN